MRSLNKKSKDDVILDIAIYVIIAFIFLVTLYPFYYALVMSFSQGADAVRGGIYFWPRKFTLENYKVVMSIDYIYSAMYITVARTVVGTLATLAFTGLFAYSIAHRNLMFRNFYVVVMIITLYFSGGLVPYYMLLRQIGLTNNFLVYIVPNLLAVFNAIIMISFFREIPDSIEEAAHIDGAGDLTIFFKIIIPISMPLFATMALYTGVWHWNAWSDAAFFVSKKSLKTLSYVLINLINQTDAAARLTETSGAMGTMNISQTSYTAETLRPAAMLIVVLPIVCVYPFLQKYFMKGIMIGSVKG
jgi:putative aldouronate transport system permease protein